MPYAATIRGFTLIELLVVVSIIGVLAALLMPAIGMVMDSARKTQCLSNLRQIGIASASYVGDWEGVLPGPLLWAQGAFYRADTNGVMIEGHLISLLAVPYLGEPVPEAGAANARNAKVFLCPAWVQHRRSTGSVSGSCITGAPFQANTAVLGYFGSASAPRSEPKPMSAVSNPAQQAVFYELDEKCTGVSPGANYADVPVHKNLRNLLYADGHVGGIKVGDPYP